MSKKPWEYAKTAGHEQPLEPVGDGWTFLSAILAPDYADATYVWFWRRERNRQPVVKKFVTEVGYEVEFSATDEDSCSRQLTNRYECSRVRGHEGPCIAVCFEPFEVTGVLP